MSLDARRERAGLRIAVVAKQVPRADSLELGPDGRLRRDGVGLETNPHCRRALAEGVALAADTGGTCVVFTLGPPSAEEVLREAVAGGAHGGVHLCDPAFAGSDSLATARALALPTPAPRSVNRVIRVETVPGRSGDRLHVTAVGEDAVATALWDAEAVVCVGQGVPPDAYGELDDLLGVLKAELGATRKVTDRGWLPRSRQVGITGHSLAPALYMGIGTSGKFNHLAGVARAGTILLVNHDPAAPGFESADIGIVADWRRAVPALVAAVLQASLPEAQLRRPAGSGATLGLPGRR